MTIRKGKPGNCAHADMRIWYGEPERGIQDFHVIVTANPERPGGHPNLFRMLTTMLGEIDSPRPPIREVN